MLANENKKSTFVSSEHLLNKLTVCEHIGES